MHWQNFLKTIIVHKSARQIGYESIKKTSLINVVFIVNFNVRQETNDVENYAIDPVLLSASVLKF